MTSQLTDSAKQAEHTKAREKLKRFMDAVDHSISTMREAGYVGTNPAYISLHMEKDRLLTLLKKSATQWLTCIEV